MGLQVFLVFNFSVISFLLSSVPSYFNLCSRVFSPKPPLLYDPPPTTHTQRTSTNPPSGPAPWRAGACGHTASAQFCFTTKEYSLFKTKLPAAPNPSRRRSDTPPAHTPFQPFKDKACQWYGDNRRQAGVQVQSQSFNLFFQSRK